jgi:pimeloyl-ACP methyl ester carboxylesterase
MMLLLYPVSSFKLNLINILPRSLWGELISEEEIRDIFFSDQTSADSVKRFLPMFQHESLRAIFEMTCCDFFMPEKIRVPVLVMGGEKDIIIPPWFVRNTASFHETPPVIIENEGHAAMLSDDWRKSADIIIDWLDGLQFT